jgi:hypothetical protein
MQELFDAFIEYVFPNLGVNSAQRIIKQDDLVSGIT